jgi:hypothetical protein
MPSHRGLIDLGVSLLALALLGVGAVSVFEADNGTASAAMLAAGTTLLVIVALGDRLESIRFGQVELGLRRAADEAAAAGDEERAQQLRIAADTVAHRAASVARTYEEIRRSRSPGPSRTAAMEAVVDEARGDAKSGHVLQAEDLDRFLAAGDGLRIYALGFLEEKPQLASFQQILDVVRRPRSDFELSQALVVARAALPRWDPDDQKVLRAELQRQLDANTFPRRSRRFANATAIVRGSEPSADG